MKKLINLTWILVILMCTGLTSCSDNGDEQQNIDIELLYGSWYYEDGSYSREYITFQNNGTLIDEEKELIDGSWETISTDRGSWEYTNDELYIEIDDEAIFYTIELLDDERLILSNETINERVELFRD